MIDGLSFNEEKHEYYYKGKKVPGVTGTINKAGLSDYSMVDPVILEKSIEYGNAVHTLTELHDQDNLSIDSVDPLLLPCLDQYMKFLNDYKVEIIEIEKIIFDPILFYAGKLDRVARIMGRLAIYDVKTGAKMKSHQIQTSAYKEAYIKDKRVACDRYTLYLKEDSYKLRINANRNDFQVFKAALVIGRYLTGC